ncbi:hypothetical protein BDW22DRAFT_1422564 [Trametopsis cervina]|nr:hypothetical protein BDW22DRAFT_1422564 [Trametopsis cervina]
MDKYHHFGLYRDAPGLIVPQRVYESHGVSYTQDQPIRFTQDNVPVLLEEARLHRPFVMDHGDTRPLMSTSADKITIRIEWPGYNPWNKAISVRESNQSQGGTIRVSKSRLAYLIAKAVREFYNDTSRYDSTADHHGWDLSNIPFDRLRLLQLEHVAAGSWQPVLSYCAHH